MQRALSRLKVEDLTTVNDAMARCLRLAALAASSDVPVVLLGETGTGKTLLAHAIHNSSARAERAFVAFNASAMSDTLIESQLFEIADMSPLAQVKILRVLEYGEFERLGSEQMLHSDARIVCATNCSLLEQVRQGKFREDLYHRLNGLTLLIPPLRERMEELPALIAAELKASAVNEGKRITAIHPEAMDKLIAYPWPGNLRELNHTVRTMTLFCEGRVILPEHVVFPPDLKSRPPPVTLERDAELSPNGEANMRDLSLAAAVARHVKFVYNQAGRNQRRTARLLGISRATLARHLRAKDQK